MKNVVLIGRPNVGKSSLFNALLGFRRTIVWDQPGTTLDLVREKVKWADLEPIDSQGIFGEGDSIVLQKILAAGDLYLFVVDAISGPTPFDRWIAEEIRLAGKPTLLVINKSDGKGATHETVFAELGIVEAVAASAVHRRGLDTIREWSEKHLPAPKKIRVSQWQK